MQKIIFGFIKFYQIIISPLKRSFLPYYSPCCFYPTCSKYSILAIKKYGLWKGLWKTILRILRCNELSKNVVDFP